MNTHLIPEKLMNDSIPNSTNGHANGSGSEPLTQLIIPGAEPGHGKCSSQIASIIRALLYVAPEPPTIAELAAGSELSIEDIERGLRHLHDADDGLVIQRVGDQVSLGTSPRFASHIRQFLGLDREARLSSAALETLAIVAYRQPVTRSEIEAIRGVDCSGVIATLHARELIEPVSRRPTIGNPIQYGTTAEFLRHFGLGSLAELPALGVINGEPGQDVLANAMQGEPGDKTTQERSETSD